LLTQSYEDAQIYPVAGKCGVFAETDITGLQKQGVPPAHLMASMFHAIVLQNLSVLARGYTLRPTVFLLGGPNAYFPGLQAAWRKGLLDLWERKNIELPEGATPEMLITVPPMAEYFAAIGAIEFGVAEMANAAQYSSAGQYQGTRALEDYIREEAARGQGTASTGLCSSDAELDEFRRSYSLPAAQPPTYAESEMEVFVGLDGGSTSTKAVALTREGRDCSDLLPAFPVGPDHRRGGRSARSARQTGFIRPTD
jgi:activator of 2-hydroxyglutaryl-CoA dehydratase